jgi:hypothetical protein
MNNFYKMSMQETSSTIDFLFIIKDLLGQIVGVGDVIRDEDVLTVLNAFPDSYENFVQSVSAQWTLPNFDQLTSRLLQEAQRRELHGDQTKSEEALLLKFKNLLKKKKIDKGKHSGRPRKCHNCGNQGHWAN